ncbi:MAG TPA: hypothetical protein PK283_07895, partial [Thiotrichales bacterium]|nr:hypothetical protein [Thiotrichales bacterium]
ATAHAKPPATRKSSALPPTAIWSCPPAQMLEYPAYSLLSFFKNHGLLQLEDRPQWETVIGGSRNYLQKLHQHPNIQYCEWCEHRAH